MVKLYFALFTVFVTTVFAQSNSLFTWRPVNTQGMGFVTGITASKLSPYDIYIRTDVGGLFRWDRRGNRWVSLSNQYGIDKQEVVHTEAVAVDPSNPRTVYMATEFGRNYVQKPGSGGSPGNDAFYDVTLQGEVLVSTDRGASWKPTGLAASNIYMGSNDEGRGTSGERLAVDPLRPGQLYFASRKDGFWRLIPGQGWSKVTSNLPSPASATSTVFPPNLDAFKAELGYTFVEAGLRNTPAGKQSVIATGIWGKGVYLSYDGGDSWASIGGSFNPARAAFSADGNTLYLTFGDEKQRSGGVMRYDLNTRQLKSITPTTKVQSFNSYSNNPSMGGVSTDPIDVNTLTVAQNNDWIIYQSNDRGEHWTQIPFPKTGTNSWPTISNEPGYYVKPKASNFFTPAGVWGNAGLLIDPDDRGKLWQTNGYGVMRAVNYKSLTPGWTWIMTNLEELVVRNLRVPPVATLPSGEKTADLFSVVADMVGFRHDNWNAPPSKNLLDFPWVSGGTGIDYSFQAPQYMAMVGFDQANYKAANTGWSSDHGKTWTPFPTNLGTGFDYGGVNPHQIYQTGGKIAISSTNPQNMVWASTGFQTPNYTKDGGKTWLPCRTTTGEPLPANFQSLSEWWHGETIIADKVNGNRFYYIESGIWQSLDGGATWQRPTRDFGGASSTLQWTILVNLTAHPYNEGEIWVSFLRNQNDPLDKPLWHSRDGGRTVELVTGFQTVHMFTLGAGATSAKPFWYVFGRQPGAKGDTMYKSENEGLTWTAISNPALNQFPVLEAMEGDLRTRNVLYIGMNGRGMMRGELLPSVPFFGLN